MDKQKIQNRIKNLVEAYKRLFPEEYTRVCEAVIMLRQVQEDEFGSLKVETSGVAPQRILHEIPEKLYMSFIQELTEEELTYWKSKEGGRWFCKEFPMFSVTKI